MPRHPPYALISLISVCASARTLRFLVSFLTSSFQVNYKTYFIHLKDTYLFYSYSYYLCVLFICSCQCAFQGDKKSIKYKVTSVFFTFMPAVPCGTWSSPCATRFSRTAYIYYHTLILKSTVFYNFFKLFLFYFSLVKKCISCPHPSLRDTFPQGKAFGL